LSFSANGKKHATGSGDATTKVWDFASGADILTLEGNRKSDSRRKLG
jgi:WD40 repeat protein